MQNENAASCECICKNRTNVSVDSAENFDEKNDWWFALAIVFILLWLIVVPIAFFCRTMRMKKQKLIFKRRKRRRGRKARSRGGRLTRSTYLTKLAVDQTKIVAGQAKSTKPADSQMKLTYPTGVIKKQAPNKGDFEKKSTIFGQPKSTNKVAAQ